MFSKTNCINANVKEMKNKYEKDYNRFVWRFLSKYTKLLNYMSIYSDNGCGSIHLENGMILDFDNMKIIDTRYNLTERKV